MRSFGIYYRVNGLKTLRRTNLGRYPQISLKDAHQRADLVLETAAHGKDPAAEKKQQRANTIEAVICTFCDVYLEHGGKRPHAPSYIKATRRLFERHVIPRWRGRPINTITRATVSELLGEIRKKQPNRIGGPLAANRTLAAVRKLFNWSIQQGKLEVNPATLIERPSPEEPRDRTLTCEEISMVWSQMKKLERMAQLGDDNEFNEKKFVTPLGQFFKLLLVTGQRRTAVAHMRWQDISDTGVWTIPAGPGMKSKHNHTVPLSSLAQEILAECPRQGEYIFPISKADRPVSGFGPFKRQLDKLVATEQETNKQKQISAWTLHDLRRTAASLMRKELRLSTEIIGRVLGHAEKGFTERHYLKLDLIEEKHDALEAWGTFLTHLVSVRTTNIVDLKIKANQLLIQDLMAIQLRNSSL